MMKIPRYLRGSAEWPFEVRGGDREPKACRSEAMAIALAMSRAMLSGRSYEVYEHGDRIGAAEFDAASRVTAWRRSR